MNIKITYFLLLLLIGYSCQSEVDELDKLDDVLKKALIASSPDQNLSYYQLPSSEDFSRIPQDKNNPLTEKKVALGKLLFHETAIGIEPMMGANKGKYSCASCHHAQAGFSAGTFQGIGEGGLGFGIRGERRSPDALVADHDVQPIKSPTILNAAYQQVMLWNGQFGANGLNVGTQSSWTPGTPKETNNLGFDGVETQAIAGLKVHRQNIDQSVLALPGYKALFDEVFADIPVQNRYTRVTTGLAIAAYERTVLANNSPWQKYLKGNTIALSHDQKRGAILFFTKAKCESCHTGPALNSMSFHAIGMNDLVECPQPTLKTSLANAENLGRGGFTGKQEDFYKFKVPQLYNLKDVNFFGHGSSYTSVKDVIQYKNKGVGQNKQVDASRLDKRFQPLGLTEEEIDQLTKFVEFALYDPTLKRFVPNSLPSGLCFPNADAMSRSDLRCN